jgi:hypothetical protein
MIIMIKKIKYVKISLLFALILSLTSCLKKDDIPEISKVQAVIEFPLGGPGLQRNNLSAFSTDVVDTVIALNIASPDPLKTDVNVSIIADPTAVADYNAANGTSYVAAPSNYFELQSSTIAIPAGYRVGKVKVRIFFNRFDLTKNYMLALKITDGQGLIISGNYGKFLWAFVVKNPLEGTYNRNFYRWNGTQDTTTAPNSTVTLNVGVNVPTVTGSTVLLPESYMQSFVGAFAGITLSFTSTGGVLGNFSVSLDPATIAGLAAGGFTVITPPKLVGFAAKGNAADGYRGTTFRTYMVIQNSTPAIRTVIDEFVKQ